MNITSDNPEPSNQPAPPKQPAWKRAKRRQALLGILCIAIIVAVGVAIVWGAIAYYMATPALPAPTSLGDYIWYVVAAVVIVIMYFCWRAARRRNP
ncbi:MAG TPA: hypothetical protein VKM55_18105 [Candidatus Lokiarchaeia archaeon]|nr:hypothetical protein [Candidatus Lokiarchaeia archaeon]